MLTNQTTLQQDNQDNHEAVVLGVFETRAAAESAIQALHAVGFGENEIGFVMRESNAADVPAGSMAAAGAASGIVSGTLAGGLIGALAALLLPGFGPIIAGGILSGMLIGGTAGGLMGALAGMGMSDEEVAYYHGRFEMGHALVSVRVGERRQQAVDVLRRNGAYDMVTQKSSGAL